MLLYSYKDIVLFLFKLINIIVWFLMKYFLIEIKIQYSTFSSPQNDQHFSNPWEGTWQRLFFIFQNFGTFCNFFTKRETGGLFDEYGIVFK